MKEYQNRRNIVKPCPCQALSLTWLDGQVPKLTWGRRKQHFESMRTGTIFFNCNKKLAHLAGRASLIRFVHFLFSGVVCKRCTVSRMATARQSPCVSPVCSRSARLKNTAWPSYAGCGPERMPAFDILTVYS